MDQEVISPVNRVKLIRHRSPRIERMREGLTNPLSVTRELNNRSLYHFMECFWSEVSNEEFKPNWHIEKVLCPELERVAYRVANNLPKEYDLIFNVPPGTTKTITVSIMFPVWCWTKWFGMRFITASHSSPLSLESAEHSRDLMRSDKFRAIYPELSIKKDKDTKGNFKVIKKVWGKPGKAPRILLGGNRYSTSVGGSAIGFHGHINIWDDLIDPLQAVSEVQLETANYFLDRVLSMRKVDKLTTVIIGIMQRLHQNDPTGHVLTKKKKGVRHISLPGEIRNYREQVQPSELIKYYKDDLLDPVRMNWKVLEDMEADLGQYGFAGQVGQKPTPPGGGMFKVDHFNIIQSLPPPVNFLQTVRSWDKAGTEGGGAYTAGIKMSLLTNKRWIVQDVKRGQWSSEERERIIREVAEVDGTSVRVLIEQEPGSGGKESAEGTILNLAGFVCEAKPSTGSKTDRADQYSVQVNNGNIMLLNGDWNHSFIEEHRFFPFSTYKDQVDAVAGAFNKLTKKRNVKVIR